MKESPIAHWFPEGSYFTYGTIEDAANVIMDTPLYENYNRARDFEVHARANYTADKIYKGILEKL